MRALDWSPGGTVWGDYYEATNYTDAAFAHKHEIVSAAIDRIAPAVVWDLGANDGTFSRLASARGIPTVAFDVVVILLLSAGSAVATTQGAASTGVSERMTSPAAAISPLMTWDLVI